MSHKKAHFQGNPLYLDLSDFTEGEPVSALPGVPQPHEVFDKMAIRIPSGKQVQFVVGDNLDGYYNGLTYSDNAPGYIHSSGSGFRSALWFEDGKAVENMSDCSWTDVLPFGTISRHGTDIQSQMCIHSGNRAVSLRCSSTDRTRRAQLSVRASFHLPITELGLTAPGILTAKTSLKENITSAGMDEWYVAAAASAEVEVQIVGQGFELRSQKAVPELTVVLGFGATEKEAESAVKRLISHDPFIVEQNRIYTQLAQTWFWTDSDQNYSKASLWAKYSAGTMLVNEFGLGIWAGLPWFKDYWGRDTFITFPGALLAAGHFSAARELILSFSDLQCLDTESPYYGRIPNRVTTPDKAMYNTTDGTAWMLREIMEYLRYTGDTAFAAEIYPVIERAVEGGLKNYADESGFLNHHAADTWMDAKFLPDYESMQGKEADRIRSRLDADSAGLLPWSGRESKAVEIQVLWHTALETAIWIARRLGMDSHVRKWESEAAKLRENFLSEFWNSGRGQLADRIRSDGRADYSVRPNQLLLLTLPFETRMAHKEIEIAVLRNAVDELLVPHGVLSLSQNHLDSDGNCWFHPYHDNQALYHKDAAYHNGTIWHWNAGFMVSALVRYGMLQNAAELSSNLAAQILTIGCVGALSENMDAFPAPDGGITPSGTFSQAWSVSEFVRNTYQDYAGFRPNLLEGKLFLLIAAPDHWEDYQAVYTFGCPASGEGRLEITFTSATRTLSRTKPHVKRRAHVSISYYGSREDLSLVLQQAGPDGPGTVQETSLVPGKTELIEFDRTAPQAVRKGAGLQMERIFQVQQGNNILQGIIESQQNNKGTT
ncbi:amylo-alpha-1,6-glucosidase [Spirochaeta dissipatitropha]